MFYFFRHNVENRLPGFRIYLALKLLYKEYGLGREGGSNMNRSTGMHFDNVLVDDMRCAGKASRPRGFLRLFRGRGGRCER